MSGKKPVFKINYDPKNKEYIYVITHGVMIQIKADDDGVVVDLYEEADQEESRGSTWMIYPEHPLLPKKKDDG